MTRFWSIVLAGAAAFVGNSAARAQGPLDLKTGKTPIEVKVPDRKMPVSYATELADVLEETCAGCHGSALAENKLSLESVPAMLKGGKRGPALVPGKAGESLLFRMAAHQVEPAMPPKDKAGNTPLTPQELGLLKLWIDGGARDDSEASPEAPKRGRATPVVLGELPPGVHPINAVDLTADGARVAAGRANVVQVLDVDSGLEIVTLGGHKDLIQSLRFSPDGGLLAAGGFQIVSLWNAPTGGPLKTLSGHAGPIPAVAVSADEKRAFSGGEDRTLRSWDLAEGKQQWTLTLPSPITALAVTAGGKSLLAGTSDGTIRLIDIAGHREPAALKGHTAAVEGLISLRPDGSRVRFASASADGTSRVWTVPTVADPATAKDGKPAQKGEPASIVLSGHKGAVHALAATNDPEVVITAGEDATIRKWDPRDGKPTGSLGSGHTGAITALAISPDGKTLASGSADKSLRLAPLGGGSPPRTLGEIAGTIHGLAFSARGDRLAAAGAGGGIKVWETGSGRGVIAFGHTPVKEGGEPAPPVRRITFTGEGNLITASADGTLRTWTFKGSWTERGTFGPHVDRVLALDFSPDGKWLATGGGEPTRSGEVKIWDVGRGVVSRSLDSLHSDTVFALRFSPDGTRLASAAADKFLKVSRVSDGQVLRSFEGHTHHVMAVDWKADGKQIITGGADKVLKLWDFETGEQVRTLQEAGKQITAARWIAGKPEVLASSGDAQVRIWNPDSGAVARGFGGVTDYVYCVAASADGRRVAAGGADGVLFLWNGPDGKLLRKPPPPASPPAPRR